MGLIAVYTAASTAQATGPDTSTVQTLSPATGARACLITVSTNGAYMTFDGSAPSSTNGMAFPKDGVPAFFPTGGTIKFVSQAAGNSVVNVTWLK